MSYSIDATVTMGEDHVVTLTLPADVPPGELRITGEVKPTEQARKLTGAELADSEFFGDWADRDDLPRTNEEFIQWRRRLWERSQE